MKSETIKFILIIATIIGALGVINAAGCDDIKFDEVSHSRGIGW